jgi:hypothetical protein
VLTSAWRPAEQAAGLRHTRDSGDTDRVRYPSGPLSRAQKLQIGVLLGVIACAFALAGFWGYRRREDKIADREAAAAKDQAEELDRRHWHAAGALEPCLLEAEWDEVEFAAIEHRGPVPPPSDIRCYDAIETLTASDGFLAGDVTSLRALKGADHAIHAATDPDSRRIANAKRYTLLRDIREHVLPQLRAKLSSLIDARPHDAAWWKLHARFAAWGILRSALEASKLEEGAVDLAAAAAAIKERVAAFEVELAGAPKGTLEFDYFAKAIDAGQPLDIYATTRLASTLAATDMLIAAARKRPK